MRIDYGPGYRVYFSRGLLARRRAYGIELDLFANDMTKTKTTAWDAADHLKTQADVVAYLEAAFEDGDPAVVAAALGDIARAKGMTKIAQRAGLGRESLYKALSQDGNPELATVLRVVRALGLRLQAVAR